MLEGFMRVAACCPKVEVANVDFNINNICEVIEKAARSGASVAVTPELCVTAYTCADLFHNDTLLEAAERGIDIILTRWKPYWPLTFIGMPVTYGGSLYNCAVALDNGRIAGIVPKTYLPDYNEFYEKRWFSPAPSNCIDAVATIGKHSAPFGTNLLFSKNGVTIGAELCEDLWAPVPPSCNLTLGGAEVVVNLSASDDVVGKFDYLRTLVAQQAARCICGYVYTSAGYGESSTDLVFSSKGIIAENGHILACERPESGSVTLADIDIEALRRDRRHLRTFGDCASRTYTSSMRTILCADYRANAPGLLHHIDPHPFVPADDCHLAARCEEILAIQSAGLRKRLDVTHCNTIVVGISGGLDSTLALLVAVRTFDQMGLDRHGIIGVTMPGFGTTGRTHANATMLMEALGVTIREISIVPAVMQHFADIGHDAAVHDVTYENSQARERTQLLMDIANATGGMVLGTGDLSELALGWATYNGDHMSMYGVNAGVPKTLVKHLVAYYADCADNRVKDILADIIDTPISPELIPADDQGNITQKTEDLVGPYELHDFFLYYMLRYGFSPRRIYGLAREAFAGCYSDEVIVYWLRTFIRRFFNQQFKRSCLPDGPKVGSVTLSPRGDWRMPSDASAALWLSECDSL